MRNLLIKMSRRRSLMVPVVTLLAIGIGISGYYIQNRQIVAREQEEQAQKDQSQAPQSFDSTQLSPVETVDESTRVKEDGQAAKVVNVKLSVSDETDNNEVVLAAEIDSKEPGVCSFYFKQANYGPEETVTVKDTKCEVRLQNPGKGNWESKVLFTSDDGQTRGDAKQDTLL